jgi:hypothetical protein
MHSCIHQLDDIYFVNKLLVPVSKDKLQAKNSRALKVCKIKEPPVLVIKRD